jgi:outer membrane protein assembly factor BamB
MFWNRNNTFFVKLDSNGNKLWEVDALYQYYDIALDASNNLYATSYTTGIIKLNTTDGSLMWDREMFVDQGNIYYERSVVAPDGSVYLIATRTNDNYDTTEIVIAKLTQSGDTTWIREIEVDKDNPIYILYAVASPDSVVLAYNNDTDETIIIAKLLASGEGAGAHGEFLYSQSDVNVRVAGKNSPTPSVSVGVELLPVTATNSNHVSFVNTTHDIIVDMITRPGAVWAFNTNGTFETPNYTFPARKGRPGEMLTATSQKELTWSMPGGGSGGSCKPLRVVTLYPEDDSSPEYVLQPEDGCNTLINIEWWADDYDGDPQCSDPFIIWVPADVFPIGTAILIGQIGDRPVEINSKDVWIRSPETHRINKQYGKVTLIKVDDSEGEAWDLEGNLMPMNNNSCGITDDA